MKRVLSGMSRRAAGVALSVACCAAPVALAPPVGAVGFSAWAAAPTQGGDEAGARGALEEAFRQLRAGDYASLYDVLPSASQRRLSRGRFVEALNRVRGMYELNRLEVTNTRAAGDFAVADTVIYGRALRPVQGEGKIVARQYLVREGGRWRVTTGDRQTVRPLLAANPDIARRFPYREPRVYIKREGSWVDVTTLANRARRRPTR